MPVEARSEHPRGRAALQHLRTRARAYLVALDRADSALSILVVTDAAIRRLNRRWRGVDRATDVLSFPTEPSGNGPHLGDVVISLDTAARRARAEGRALGAELDRYLAHGMLHLLGYDHERERDARKMAERENALVRAEGLLGASFRQVSAHGGRRRGGRGAHGEASSTRRD